MSLPPSPDDVDHRNSERPTIAVLRRIPDVATALLRGIGEVHSWDADEPIPHEHRDALLADADAVVTLLTDRVDASFLAAAPCVKIVANVAVGYDNIDVAACSARGVVVTNTPGVLTEATADLAMGLILSSTRRIAEGDRLIRSGTPWKWGMFMMLGTGLQGRTLGIIGLGGIGRALARRARAFGMDVVYHNRSALSADIEHEVGARWVPLGELFATSDVVSLHCPATPDTHHLVDAHALASMRPSAYLINTARGSIVDEAALVDALASGEIAGAGLDVFEHEPDVHPGLLLDERVVLVPHLGSATVDTREQMALTAARNVAAVLAGHPALDPVHL